MSGRERPRVAAAVIAALVVVLALAFLAGGAVFGGGSEVPASTQTALERAQAQVKARGAGERKAARAVKSERGRADKLAGQLARQRKATRAEKRSARRWAARYRRERKRR